MVVQASKNLIPRRRNILLVLLLCLLAGGGWLAYENYVQPHQTEEDLSGSLTAIGPGGAVSGLGSEAYPSFDVVRVTRGGAGLMTGHAPPAAKVEVLADGKLIGDVTADAKGEWVLIFSEPFKIGGVELSLQLARPLLAPASKLVKSPVIVVVVVPGVPQDHFVNDEGEGVVVIASPRYRVGSSLIMQRPGRVTAGEAADGLGFEAMDYGDDGKAILSGRAPAYSDVRVYIENKFQGSGVADQTGKWEVALKDPVAVGHHVLRVDQVADKGKVELRIETEFERLTPLDQVKTSEKIMVQTVNDLWRISRRIVGNGFHYTLIFKADKDQVKDPELMYPGQVVDLPAAPATQP